MAERVTKGKVVVLANRKGGVGKTTTAICIAKTFQSQMRKSTIVIDTDPQASASLALAGEEMLDETLSPMFLERTLDDPRLDDRRPDFNCFHRRNVSALAGDTPLGLVPISPAFWRFERKIWFERSAPSGARIRAANRYRKLLNGLRRRFDLVVIDTPPGLSMLFEHSLRAADLLLVPCIPDRVSLWGLNVLKEEFDEMSGSKPLARLIWTQFTETAAWREKVAGEFDGTLPFEYFSDESAGGREILGVGRSVKVPEAVTDISGRPMQERFPQQVMSNLLRISEAVDRLTNGEEP